MKCNICGEQQKATSFVFDLRTHHQGRVVVIDPLFLSLRPLIMVLNRLVNAIPGSQGTKVFVGTTVALGLCALSFFGGKAKKSGHGAFDSDRPQAVQLSMDEAEKNRLKKISPLPEKR